jgi:hypothetical protein
MADVSGKFFSAKKVRTGVSPSSPGIEVGETLPPVNPPGGALNSVGLTMPSAFNVANSPLTSNGSLDVTGAGTISQYIRGDGTLDTFPSLTGYVPYTGANQTVNLNTQQLQAGHTTLTTNGSTETLTINHTSGSGKAINVTKGGAGEGLYVNKTSGSGNAATIVGTLEATTLVKTGGTSAQFLKADGSVDSTTYQNTADKGQPNGYASLDGNGKVPLVQINDALIGNVNFQGLWNASTNTPTLVDPPSSGTKGYYYIVSTGGTFAGITFEVGDWIISNGTAWGKVDNTDAVSSVFGRTGNVTASNGDYNTSQVTESGNLYYTDARSRAALSFAAGSGAYNSGTGVITIPTNNNQITNGAGYITSAALAGYVQGSGTTNYLPKFTGASTIGNSIVQDNGSTITVGGSAYIKAGNGNQLTLDNAGERFTQISFNNNTTSKANIWWDNTNTELVLLANSVGSGHLRIASTGAATFSSSVTANSFIKSGGTSSQYLMADGSVSTLSNPVTGTGTTNYLPKFTGASTIGNSVIQDSGSLVTINSETKFQVSANATRNVYFGTSATNYGRITYNDSTGELAIGTIENYSTLFISNNTTKMTLNSSGNLGLGVTPSAWLTASGRNAIEIGALGNAMFGNGASDFYMLSNAFTDGTFKYANNGPAASYRHADGAHIWYQAPSGTAGNAISFTQAMTLNASGNLSIGNTNDTYKLDVSGTGRFSLASTGSGAVLNIGNVGSGVFGGLAITDGGTYPMRVWGSELQFLTGSSLLGSATTRLTIASTGAATFSSTINAGNSANTSTADSLLLHGKGALSGGIPYGDYGSIVLSADSSYTSGARRFLITNAFNATRFAIIQSVDSNTTPTLGAAGAVTSGNLIFSVSNTGTAEFSVPLIGTSATFSSSVTAASLNTNRISSTTSNPLIWNTAGVSDWFLGSSPLGNSTSDLSLYSYGTSSVVLNIARATGAATFSSWIRTFGDIYAASGTATAASIRFWDANTGLYHPGSDALGFIASGAERMRITSSGSVGIGTAIPASKLQIEGTGTGAWLTINRTDSGTNIIDYTQSGTRLGYIGYIGSDLYLNNATASNTAFFTNSIERMRIFSDGNVGINTGATNNGAKLQVSGGGAYIKAGNGNQLTLDNAGERFTQIIIGNNTTSKANIWWDNTNTELVLLANSVGSGHLRIASTGAATFSSSVTATSFFESSDASLKTLVEDNYQAKGIDSVVAKLYIKNGKEELGYYAQDLQGVLPSAVSKGSDGLLNLSYREVHTAKIAYLEEKIKQLEHELGRISK